MAPRRRPARTRAAPARRAGEQARPLGRAGPGADRPRPRRPHRPRRAAPPRRRPAPPGPPADAVLPDLGADAIAAALGPVVAGDAVLCSDGAKAYAAFAAERGIRHE